jgi:hypothetical protein
MASNIKILEMVKIYMDIPMQLGWRQKYLMFYIGLLFYAC